MPPLKESPHQCETELFFDCDDVSHVYPDKMKVIKNPNNSPAEPVPLRKITPLGPYLGKNRASMTSHVECYFLGITKTKRNHKFSRTFHFTTISHNLTELSSMFCLVLYFVAKIAISN